MMLTIHLYLVPRLRISGAILLLFLYSFMARTGVYFTFSHLWFQGFFLRNTPTRAVPFNVLIMSPLILDDFSDILCNSKDRVYTLVTYKFANNFRALLQKILET